MEFGFGEPAAAEHHAGAFLDVADRLQRVRVEEQQVGAVAGGDEAERVFGFQIIADVFGGGLQDLVRRETGIDVGLHLADDGESGDAELLGRIGAEENRDAAVDEGFEHDLAVGGDLPGAGGGEFRVREPALVACFPTLDFGARHVAEFGVGKHRGEIGGTDDGFPERHRRHHERAGVAEEFHHRRKFGGIDGGRLRPEVFDGAVEVVDGLLPALDRVNEADIGGNVPGKPDAHFVGGFGHGVVDVAFEAGQDFEQIPALGFLFAHAGFGGGGRAGRSGAVAGEGRSGQIEGGAGDGAGVYEVAEFELAGPALHAAKRGDAVGDEEKKDLPDILRRGAEGWVVTVHLAEAGHEEFAGAVDPTGIGGDGHGGGVAEADDAVAGDDDRLIFKDALGVHGQDGDVDERSGGGRGGVERGREGEGEGNEEGGERGFHKWAGFRRWRVRGRRGRRATSVRRGLRREFSPTAWRVRGRSCSSEYGNGRAPL